MLHSKIEICNCDLKLAIKRNKLQLFSKFLKMLEFVRYNYEIKTHSWWIPSHIVRFKAILWDNKTQWDI